jgi:hypothetical protein
MFELPSIRRTIFPVTPSRFTAASAAARNAAGVRAPIKTIIDEAFGACAEACCGMPTPPDRFGWPPRIP